ncbi:hypothetical protein MMC09_005017 [Bachmanniomyces sp. S44760]|nr:hypothetical protein [Bachmanniomyces sp. S44760]
MADEQDKLELNHPTEEQATPTSEEEAASKPPKKDSKGNPLSSYGNTAGSKIESTLSPINNTVGTGLETVGKPVGGLVEPVVGGLFKSAGAWGETLKVGAGNMEHKDAAAAAERAEPVGGKEQTGQNPLGLEKE